MEVIVFIARMAGIRLKLELNLIENAFLQDIGTMTLTQTMIIV